MLRTAVLAAILSSAVARADPQVLRLATVVPNGTAWAREGKAFAQDVESLSHGRLRIKWYLGAIAGDEAEVKQRIGREQLDGAALSMECYRLSPTMRVVRLVGLVQSRDEAAYVIGRLKQTIDGEFGRQGFVNLMDAGVGSDVLFTRAPVRTFDELRSHPLWVWDLDDTLREQLDGLGVPTVPLPINQAAPAYDARRTDGFIAVPTAALAFQWSAQATSLTELPIAFVEGCLVVATRAFDELPSDSQRALRTAAAKLQARFEDLGRAQDAALLGGLFAHQGVRRVPLTERLRSEFFDAATAARERVVGKLVSRATLQRVLGLLADYRAEHH
jgi:TRAP-type transport system periplasmic protein